MSLRVKFGLIIVFTILMAVLAYPREDQILRYVGLGNVKLQLRQGLDLQGGAHLVYQADMSKVASGSRDQAMTSLISVIQRRVNPSGTSEVNVTSSGSDRVVIELPGVKDLSDAINTIGKTADLEFLEVTSDASGNPSATPTGITGKDVDSANVDFDTQTGNPIVSLQLKGGDSTTRFGTVTTEINKNGTQLVTMLDQDVIFGPATVSTPITDGKAQLQGSFTVDQAKKIAELINAGALPVPISLVQQQTVGATLGQDSIAHSIVAGIIGLAIVALFMILYYRLLGVVAVAALGVYTLTTIAIYKLSIYSPSPIVLTLAGIAGFILSIGMAVDANILIFERTKEEVRSGKSLLAGIEAGFDRAWPSIRDSNISTFITCFILYNFSGSIPIIKGFAVTLGLGVLISMFTAIVVSRTFLRMMIRTRLAHNMRLYGLEEETSK